MKKKEAAVWPSPFLYAIQRLSAEVIVEYVLNRNSE